MALHLKLATAALFVPVIALAQPAPPVSPEVQALQQTVLKLTSEALGYQSQAIALQRQVEDLSRQLAEARKPAEAKPAKPPGELPK